MEQKKLAICAIFRDVAPYLLEWIAYHVSVGVDAFVLYDNGSRDGGTDMIRGSPFASRATVIEWHGDDHQLAYRHFIDIFAPGYTWVAFLDVEEFLLPLNGRSVPALLDRLGDTSAVLVHWRLFGPGAWDAPPAGLVIENYRLRAADHLPLNRTIKSIVRSHDLLDVSPTPHTFLMRGTVRNMRGEEVPNVPVQDLGCHEGLVINRYMRSRQEWRARVRDGISGFGAVPDDSTLVERLAALCTIEDDTITALAPAVRSLLGLPAWAPQPDALIGAPAAAPISSGVSAEVLSPVPISPTISPPAATTAVFAGTSGATAAAAPAHGANAAAPSPPFNASAAALPLPIAPSASVQTAPSIAAPMPQAERTPAWTPCGNEAQERGDSRAFIFRDTSRADGRWLAALRRLPNVMLDPLFLLDEFGRVRDFATDAEARSACEAELTATPMS